MAKVMSGLPKEDLDTIVLGVGEKWQHLQGADILVTGGTGFFGVWLVSALLHANESLGLGLRVHVLSRNPEQLLERAPQLRDAKGLLLQAADIRSFRPLARQRITHIVHAATSASASLNDSDPIEMAHVAAEGTHHLLHAACELGVRRMLFTSSGAVYGKNPPGVTHMREDELGVLDPLEPRNAYAEGKRMAELYCSAYCQKRGLAVVIARCFAFVGPYLPLDTHFAIGNFIRDALRGDPIIVKSDGTPRRSYLYATDLTSWLVQLLVSGTPGRAYNVGSDHDVSVGELAALVGKQGHVGVEIRGTIDPNRPIESYVPSTDRIRDELGITQTVSLEKSVRQTMDWYKQQMPRSV
jgi:dTDP-glucose 4,6-dehydratase